MDAGAGGLIMRRVIFMGYDVSEASHIRTVRWLQGAGAEVESFCFRRDNMNAGFVPDWPHTSLGTQCNGGLLRRAMRLPVSALKVLCRPRSFTTAEVIVARNLDLAILALLVRAVWRARARVIYQCLDIHAIFTRPGWKGALARWAERRVLARVDRLVVSSPGFLSRYFQPVQNYQGDVALVENKVWWPAMAVPRPAPGLPIQRPIRLGWVGTLRCPQSLTLLAESAAVLGDRLEVVLRGVVHRHNLPNFDAVLRAHPNIRFEGPYEYPEGLAQAYRGLDVVWAQDLWQRGTNSDWLLPNRIYEAGYFGVPCLAVAGTETARWLGSDGVVLEDDTAKSLVNWVRSADPAKLQALRARLLASDAGRFCQSETEAVRLLAFTDRQGALDAAPA